MNLTISNILHLM